MTILLDTNILIRHLTGDPPAQAKRATRFLAAGDNLLLVDVVFAECVYMLESFYEAVNKATHWNPRRYACNILEYRLMETR